jgi:hypothetical protein
MSHSALPEANLSVVQADAWLGTDRVTPVMSSLRQQELFLQQGGRN